METVKQATTYVCENIKKLSNVKDIDALEKEIIYDMIQDKVLERFESQFNELDADLIDQDIMEEYEALEVFLKVKFPNYTSVLEDVVKEILTEYMIEDQTVAE
ncbi:hypothetical protein KKG31_07410 [Patescibacteria group bacterium]|nr:hypothetical protein [Patescibacteria group bacterium]MBU1758904.1 hypothetical protein [Patescibacteria group bacterium]